MTNAALLQSLPVLLFLFFPFNFCLTERIPDKPTAEINDCENLFIYPD